MHIETLRLSNFRAFHDVCMENIPRFSVIVGANGTGKSTLFDVFGFLRDCLTHNVTRALQGRGGFREVVTRGHEDESIIIELQARLTIANANRLVTYSLEIAQHAGEIVIERELLRYKRGPSGKPYHFLDFKRGEGTAITNEEAFQTDEELEREPQKLDAKDILAIKGLGQFERFKAAKAMRTMLEHWHVSDFHINMARGIKELTGYYDEHLSEKGENLQLVAKHLYDNHRPVFDEIISKMKHRVPGITNIETQPTPDGRLLLKFQDGAFTDPFIDRYVSDGTVKMFAYLVLLSDPSPHPLLCIEEPENQLYPMLLEELAEEFRSYARKGGQVFVSTHSPDFLNATELQEVFWLKKERGYTRIQRAKDNEQLADFMNNGDKMGYLWKQGFFDGIDSQ